ncbi:MAG: M14 family metallopeptidase [Candidatus Latescibacteria bacterium]|jgi:hypothetical protein|nr:M14 family metallopeptidase [Candidatus Latescibacterota bacterium]
MKCLFIAIILFIGLSAPASARVDLDYYLPKGVTYNPDIPTPEAFFGFQVGDWHLRHDLVVNYLHTLAESSDRITIKTYARTYEQRSLLLLTITTPKNHQNIETIQTQHKKLTNPEQSSTLDINTMPAVVYMGYSIHGNEPSGGNASSLVAYHLAAAQSAQIDSLLAKTIILLDPVFNPDGFNRFAHWANTHRGKHPIADPEHREHREVWPGGRTNHYWFDLNRDWLLLQHPESRGRLETFHTWKPNVLTDHHEMGTNSTFFFQPGIPSRNNPLTPKRTFELTAAIAERHASALDEIGSLYYTKESYDDFYIGKGSTYPDINGCIGILFEQASSRGHLQDSAHGPLSFPFAIRNQVRTSLSTLKAASELRTDLLEHQREFYTNARQEGQRASIKAYVFGDPNDPARTHHFLDLLQRHHIQIYELARPMDVRGQTFTPGSAYIIPTAQPQYRLLTAMFERRTTFQDSLFYDVSAWTLPLAFNMPLAELKSSSQEFIGALLPASKFPQGRQVGEQNPYAYLFEWKGYYAPRALYRLQKAGIQAKVATRQFRTRTAEGVRSFDYGTILIPTGIQKTDSQTLHNLMQTIAREDALDIFAIQTGLTDSGINLGSPRFATLKIPQIAILIGNGARSYNAGEAWHLLDQRYDMNVSLIDAGRLRSINLSRYNTIIAAGGAYSDLDSAGVDALKHWLQQGNTLIALNNAASWIVNRKLVNAQFVKKDPESDTDRKAYIDAPSDQGAQVVGGAIFQVQMDRTHPLAYGYDGNNLSVFRRGTLFLQPSQSPYATPFQYTKQPLLAGYISEQNHRYISESASVLVGSQGNGRVILMLDNPNFRAYWYGTQKLFANALFFGPTISQRTLREGEGEQE